MPLIVTTCWRRSVLISDETFTIFNPIEERVELHLSGEANTSGKATSTGPEPIIYCVDMGFFLNLSV